MNGRTINCTKLDFLSMEPQNVLWLGWQFLNLILFLFVFLHFIWEDRNNCQTRAYVKKTFQLTRAPRTLVAY